MPDQALPLPQTVQEAVDRLVGELSDENKARIAALSKSEITTLYFGLGQYIRNTFGLWQGLVPLLESCSAAGDPGYFPLHPDDASDVILHALWQRL